MFDYDIPGKKKLDLEMHPLIDEYYRVNAKYPAKISLSREKMVEFKSTFISVHKSILVFDGIPVELDENQIEDYLLVAE